MTTTIIIQSNPYQPPPDTPPSVFADHDQCHYCHRLSHSECPDCHLPICQHHAFINPANTQPPLCPKCLQATRLEIAAEALTRAISGMMLTGGVHGHN